MENFSAFFTIIAAVSVAVERVVEILKGSLSSLEPFKWLFTPNSLPTSLSESIRCAVLHVVAGMIGTTIAALSKVDVWQKLDVFQIPNHSPHGYYYWGSYMFTGILSSGGSAIWNHSLDILKATKIKQEQGAKAVTAANIAQTANATAPKDSQVGASKAAVPDPAAVII
jgi:hypothetical protein